MTNKEPDQRLIWMVPTIFVAMITLIAVFGKRGDSWFDFIVEFQTLITGVLAILAAYITIGQMRRSDERADKRHEYFIQIKEAEKHSQQNIIKYANELFMHDTVKINEKKFNDIENPTKTEIQDAFKAINNITFKIDMDELSKHTSAKGKAAIKTFKEITQLSDFPTKINFPPTKHELYQLKLLSKAFEFATQLAFELEEQILHF